MIDQLKMSLYLKDAYLTVGKSNERFLNYQTLNVWGFKVYAGSLSYSEIDEYGQYDIDFSQEQCPWESMPSSYGGLALKWWDSNFMGEPRLEIKASPAKLMQGHNVFGSSNIKTCALFMLRLVQDNYPDLVDAIDWKRTTIDIIDATFSARLPEKFHKQFINFLKNVSNGQMRKSVNSDSFESTCYFTSRTSKKRILKAYLKLTELNREVEQLEKAFLKNPYDEKTKTKLKILKDEKLQDWTKELVRFEARLKKDWFNQNGYPRLLTDWCKLQDEYTINGVCIIKELWEKSFAKLFEGLKGEGVNMQNELEVHNQLKSVYFNETKSGIKFNKADKLFGFYMRLVNEGYDNVYKTYDRATFGRQLKDLLDGTGLSKAQLQNLSADPQSNVIPFCKIIEIDFSNQLPDWYQEVKVIGL